MHRFWLSGVVYRLFFFFSLPFHFVVSFDTPLYPSARNSSAHSSCLFIFFLQTRAIVFPMGLNIFPLFSIFAPFLFLSYYPQGICHYFVFVVPSGMERLYCYPLILALEALTCCLIDSARESAPLCTLFCDFDIAVSYCPLVCHAFSLISLCLQSLNWTLDCYGSFHPVVFKMDLISIFASISSSSKGCIGRCA